jgi:hypothetical protein
MTDAQVTAIAAAVRAGCARNSDEAITGQLRKMLEIEFGHRRGWVRSDKWSAVREAWSDAMPPFDHPSVFRKPDGRLVLASHFYHFESAYKATCDAFVEKHTRFIYEVIDSYPSWYYPGSTDLVLWGEKKNTNDNGGPA